MKRLALAAALSLFAASAFAAPVTYKLDPHHTMVIAQWNHFGFSNPYANFGDADGTLVYDADDVSASSVEVTLPLTGLNSFARSEEHTSELQYLMRISYAVFCLKKKK